MRKRIPLFLVLILFFSSAFSIKGFAEEKLGSKVIAIAKEYIGTPYRYGGTTTAGFDCSGFTSYVFNKIGISLPRTSADQYSVGSAVSKDELVAGDLVFFTTTSARISHVGIYIGNNKFISATTSKGVKIDSLNDPYYWGSRFVGAKRVLNEATPKEEVAVEVKLPVGEYTDISKTSWMYEPVRELSKAGIINGYKDNTFLPNKEVTRAEAAKMITEIFSVKTSSTKKFNDVEDNHWATKYIAAATEQGYLSGYEGNTFKPEEPITRSEVAQIITKAFEMQPTGEAMVFKDLPEEHWAYDFIQSLEPGQYTVAYEDKNVHTNEPTTRGEFSSLLYSALK